MLYTRIKSYSNGKFTGCEQLTESQMFHLYELYKDNDNLWQNNLQELIEN